MEGSQADLVNKFVASLPKLAPPKSPRPPPPNSPKYINVDQSTVDDNYEEPKSATENSETPKSVAEKSKSSTQKSDEYVDSQSSRQVQTDPWMTD